VRALIITLITTLTMTGCTHQLKGTTALPIPQQSQVSVSQPWTVKGKLFVITQDDKHSLRFTWEHNLDADDVITIGDTLGIRRLILHGRDGMLFERLADESLNPIQAQQLEGELAALTLLSPENLAKVLTGEASRSDSISTEVIAWQSVDAKNAPRVILLQATDIEVKVVINRWELIKNV